MLPCNQNIYPVIVHAFTLDHCLFNGNDSGMGIVIRDDTSAIIKIYLGTTKNLTPRANKLWSMTVGSKVPSLIGCLL